MIKLKDYFIWTCSPIYYSCKYDNNFIHGFYIDDTVNYLALYKNNNTGINTLLFYKL